MAKPSLVTQMSFPKGQAVSFDVQAFDDAINSQGVKLVHWRAMRCPVGLVDRDDNRRPDHDHVGCSNGFIYTPAGELTALFTGNGTHPQNLDIGLFDGSTVQVTVQRFYDDSSEPVYVANYDRMYLAEDNLVVPTWQLFEAHASGREKLQFPVVKVFDLMDSDGNTYKEGVHFEVEGGYIVWKGAARPRYRADLKKGQICSIRYAYRPFWYVKQLLHEVRVTQAEDRSTGQRVIQRMPQAMVLQREYVFEKEQNDPQAVNPSSPRQVRGPADGSFGPR